MNRSEQRRLRSGLEADRHSPTRSSDISRQHSIELHIEELSLHGFATQNRYVIAQAMQRELTRLFAEQGVPPSLAQGRETGHLDGGSFQVASGSTAEAIGAQVAQALYGGLT